jgi:pSer/pThr/pTyr-binding forkhead associated (FHA) protein
MVQFKILSGKQAGTTWSARRFPVRVGRSAGSDLRLEEQGVWDEHFQVVLNPAEGVVLESQSDALVTANSQPVRRAVLRNGDLIEIGSLKMQFWLGEAGRRGLRFSEWLVWALLAIVTGGQLAIIYSLPR